MKHIRHILLLCLLGGATAAAQAPAFEYADIYLPGGDTDPHWGIWGHNLNRSLGSNPPEEVYALIEGKRDYTQLCLSSNDLYRRVARYIKNEYGESTPMRFAIFPNDNRRVCQCENCRMVGNTPTDAAPAAAALVEKLCKRFPKHQFFTSIYASTASMPQRLPENGGMLVSAIDVPLRANGKQLDIDSANRTYVWDYICNFDDYLSPFPVLPIMQQRLQHYRKQGAKGIFLNGSGPDYSTFADLHLFALRKLVDNPDADLDSLVSTFFEQNYPTAAEMLSSYYMHLANTAASRCRILPFYGGMAESIRAYLDPKEFVQFYGQLERIIPLAKKEERAKLVQLRNALSYTLLEVAYATYDTTIADNAIKHLRELPQNTLIAESGLTIQQYLQDYKDTRLRRQTNNLRIAAASPLDEDYTDLTPLTDGYNGLGCGYHYGWVLSCLEDALLLKIDQLPQHFDSITVSYYANDRIAAPHSVTLTFGEEIFQLQQNTTLNCYENCHLNITSNDNQTAMLRIGRPKKGDIIAVGEITIH